MIKILFICFANVGRSQMAEAFYNHHTKSKDAFSAGTDPGAALRYQKLPDEICKIMEEEDIDISRQKVKLINQDMIKNAEQIFVLCKKEFCPDFLLKSDKAIYWKIEDPYQMSIDNMRKVRDEIKSKVLSVV